MSVSGKLTDLLRLLAGHAALYLTKQGRYEWSSDSAKANGNGKRGSYGSRGRKSSFAANTFWEKSQRSTLIDPLRATSVPLTLGAIPLAVEGLLNNGGFAGEVKVLNPIDFSVPFGVSNSQSSLLSSFERG